MPRPKQLLLRRPRLPLPLSLLRWLLTRLPLLPLVLVLAYVLIKTAQILAGQTALINEIRVKVRDVRRQSINWTYLGPDGNATTPDSPAPYGMRNYVNQPEFYGLNNLPFVSLYRAWDAMAANPKLWTKTAAQEVTEEQFRINNSERLEEGVRDASRERPSDGGEHQHSEATHRPPA